jgi:hypothetical protein
MGDHRKTGLEMQRAHCGRICADDGQAGSRYAKGCRGDRSFYDDASTSSFIVRRDGMVVSAGAHRRNETPNNAEVDLHDKIRNTAIVLIARV